MVTQSGVISARQSWPTRHCTLVSCARRVCSLASTTPALSTDVLAPSSLETITSSGGGHLGPSAHFERAHPPTPSTASPGVAFLSYPSATADDQHSSSQCIDSKSKASKRRSRATQVDTRAAAVAEQGLVQGPTAHHADAHGTVASALESGSTAAAACVREHPESGSITTEADRTEVSERPAVTRRARRPSTGTGVKKSKTKVVVATGDSETGVTSSSDGSSRTQDAVGVAATGFYASDRTGTGAAAAGTGHSGPGSAQHGDPATSSRSMSAGSCSRSSANDTTSSTSSGDLDRVRAIKASLYDTMRSQQRKPKTETASKLQSSELSTRQDAAVASSSSYDSQLVVASGPLSPGESRRTTDGKPPLVPRRRAAVRSPDLASAAVAAVAVAASDGAGEQQALQQQQQTLQPKRILKPKAVRRAADRTSLEPTASQRRVSLDTEDAEGAVDPGRAMVGVVDGRPIGSPRQSVGLGAAAVATVAGLWEEEEGDGEAEESQQLSLSNEDYVTLLEGVASSFDRRISGGDAGLEGGVGFDADGPQRSRREQQQQQLSQSATQQGGSIWRWGVTSPSPSSASSSDAKTQDDTGESEDDDDDANVLKNLAAMFRNFTSSKPPSKQPVVVATDRRPSVAAASFSSRTKTAGAATAAAAIAIAAARSARTYDNAIVGVSGVSSTVTGDAPSSQAVEAALQHVMTSVPRDRLPGVTDLGQNVRLRHPAKPRELTPLAAAAAAATASSGVRKRPSGVMMQRDVRRISYYNNYVRPRLADRDQAEPWGTEEVRGSTEVVGGDEPTGQSQRQGQRIRLRRELKSGKFAVRLRVQYSDQVKRIARKAALAAAPDRRGARTATAADTARGVAVRVMDGGATRRTKVRAPSVSVSDSVASPASTSRKEMAVGGTVAAAAPSTAATAKAVAAVAEEEEIHEVDDGTEEAATTGGAHGSYNPAVEPLNAAYETVMGVRLPDSAMYGRRAAVLATLTPADVRRQCRSWMEACGKEYARAFHSREPTLLVQPPATLLVSLEVCSRVFDLDPEAAVQLVLRRPALVGLSEELLQSGVEAVSRALDVGLKEACKIVMKLPALAIREPLKPVSRRVELLWALLPVGRDKLRQVLRTRPQLLVQSIPRLADFMMSASNALDMPLFDVALMIVGHPRMTGVSMDRLATRWAVLQRVVAQHPPWRQQLLTMSPPSLGRCLTANEMAVNRLQIVMHRGLTHRPAFFKFKRILTLSDKHFQHLLDDRHQDRGLRHGAIRAAPSGWAGEKEQRSGVEDRTVRHTSGAAATAVATTTAAAVTLAVA